MKKGDRVVNSAGWRAEVLRAKNAKGNVLVRWQTGPLPGHEGNVAASTLKPAPRKRLRVIREGKVVEL